MPEPFCPFVNGECVGERCRFNATIPLSATRQFVGCTLVEAAAQITLKSIRGEH